MKYVVIDKETYEEVTDKWRWILTPDGTLFQLNAESLLFTPGYVAISKDSYEIVKDLAMKFNPPTNEKPEATLQMNKTDQDNTVTEAKLSAENFIKRYCSDCASQRCYGVGSSTFEGCIYRNMLRDNSDD